MSGHPGKTLAQRRVLDLIGCGDHCPPMMPATRDKLLRDGLIVELDRLVVGHDRFGVVTIPQYDMPTPVHIQWCEAMAAQSEGDDA